MCIRQKRVCGGENVMLVHQNKTKKWRRKGDGEPNQTARMEREKQKGKRGGRGNTTSRKQCAEETQEQLFPKPSLSHTHTHCLSGRLIILFRSAFSLLSGGPFVRRWQEEEEEGGGGGKNGGGVGGEGKVRSRQEECVRPAQNAHTATNKKKWKRKNCGGE